MRRLLLALVVCAGVAVSGEAAAAQANRVIIEKQRHLLSLYDGDTLLHQYRVAIGRGPAGPKHCQGDDKTPEGEYSISLRVEHSAAHRALRISYPNPADRSEAHKLGCKTGGDIMIHGLMNGYGWIGAQHRHVDWTRGCVAVTNEEMDEIWRLVPKGTKVIIKP